MRQEILDSIKSHYEDYSRMVETNFDELNIEMITPGRKKLLEGIQLLYFQWLDKELDIDDCILDEAIATVIRDEHKNKEKDLGVTNDLLMYISEMNYDTYSKILGLEKNKDPEEIYVLYMDIENKKMYFVKKEEQEQFEKTHKVIVTYKNPNCNAGWNFERNYYGIQHIRREFIKKAMYDGQEETSIQFIKKYNEQIKN